jgi:prepilin-type N-terminal cleavage/methylation domain-containing protein
MVRSQKGFTLIELSIVLVIIGLITGGVLVGRDLIAAATVRAQISQIEKYQTAVNTFRGKYGYLPGDIPDPNAGQYGFAARGQYGGEGDGNGLLEGMLDDVAGTNTGVYDAAGETLMFWVDLSQAGLIPGSFVSATSTSIPTVSSAGLAQYLPRAAIGGSNYVYIWSGGWSITLTSGDGFNYYAITSATSISSSRVSSGVGMTVQQAYAIDKKVDDGLPQSGNVLALYPLPVPVVVWAGGSGGMGGWGAPNNNPTSSSATSCYDNGGGSGPQNYSVGFNGGVGLNCALSFRSR